MKYAHGPARSAQAKGCIEELDAVLKKWNFKLVPSIFPFITAGYEDNILVMAEGYRDDSPSNG